MLFNFSLFTQSKAIRKVYDRGKKSGVININKNLALIKLPVSLWNSTRSILITHNKNFYKLTAQWVNRKNFSLWAICYDPPSCVCIKGLEPDKIRWILYFLFFNDFIFFFVPQMSTTRREGYRNFSYTWCGKVGIFWYSGNLFHTVWRGRHCSVVLSWLYW